MKKITYGLIMLFILSQIYGCKKFLEAVPYSTTSVNESYKTAADAEFALISCYNVLNASNVQGVSGGLYFMQLPLMLSGSTDEAVTRIQNNVVFNDDKNSAWGTASWTASSSYIQDVWTFLYAGIGRCNLLLEKIQTIDVPEERKQEIIGEARFLRGFYYFQLSTMFGGAPVYTTTNVVPGPRKTTKEVFDQVISDLSFAYKTLPNRAAISGRANRWSAAGILARAYAFMGSCKLNNVNTDLNFPLNNFDWVNSTDAYTNVKSLTDSIISNSGYTLTPNYGYLFKETTKKYQDDECLFMAIGSEDPTNGNAFQMANGFIPNGSNAVVGGAPSRLVPVGELYYKYQAAGTNTFDTRRTNNLTGTLNGSTIKENIDGAVYYVPKTITAAGIKTSFLYYGGKFRMIDPATKKITLTLWSGNYPILRLPEIYFLRAEAVFYLSGNTVAARADLSVVRKRSVGAANLAAINAYYLKADFIQELLDERSRELCFEAIRHLDLMRFGRLTSTINSLTNDASLAYNNLTVPTVKANWAPYKIWFPLPFGETILNKNLIQNPGY